MSPEGLKCNANLPAFVVAVLFLSVPASCSTSEEVQPLVTGHVDLSGASVCGARVALYEQDEGLLLDETLTRDDGEFTLRGPTEPGELFLVVTGEGMPWRHDFRWTAKGTQKVPVHVKAPPTAFWECLCDWIQSKFETCFDIVLGIVLGFAGGLFTKRHQDRKLLVLHCRRLICHRHRILRFAAELGRLTKQDDEVPRSDVERRGEIHAEYDKLLGDLEREVIHFGDALPDETLVFLGKGAKGVSQREELIEATATITAFSRAKDFPPRDMEMLREAIEELKNSPLLER